MAAKIGTMNSETGQAFKFFDEAFDSSEFCLFTLKYGHEWDPLRPGRGFNKFMKRMNLPRQ